MPLLILLIDDDQDEFMIMEEAIHQANIDGQCIWAAGAHHGMRLLQHVSPDYIFIDINMPAMNGIDCLKELKKDRALVNTPMVIYSTSISDDTRRTAMEEGAVCLQKTANIETLVKQLKRFITVNSQ